MPEAGHMTWDYPTIGGLVQWSHDLELFYDIGLALEAGHMTLDFYYSWAWA